MKKLVIVCLIGLSVLFSFSNVEALRIKGKGTELLYQELVFSDSQDSRIIGKNGLALDYLSPIGGNKDISTFKGEPQYYYWFRKGLGGKFCLGVHGYKIRLTNSTDRVMSIRWSQSQIRLGNYSGTVFLGGMKYSDAGNPSVIPDTIMPPQTKITMDVYIANYKLEKFIDTGWEWLPVLEPVDTDGSTAGGLYLKVYDENDTATFFVADSPAIVLPKSALAKVKIEQ